MKKLISLMCALLVSAALFAGTSAKDFLTGVYDFVKEESSSWKIYDGDFISVDTTSEEYVFTGGFVVKILVGSSRYDFVCKVTNLDDDFSVELSDMVSYSCDKSGKKLSSAKIMTTSASVANQYASQIKDEIKNRIEKTQNNDELYTQIVTSPSFVSIASKSMSDLAMKKFAENNINGKNVSFDIILDSIEENKNPLTGKTEELAYKARGSIEIIKGRTAGGLIVREPFTITVYSNNDKLLAAKIGAKYRVNGKAKFTQYSISKDWYYTVEEN